MITTKVQTCVAHTRQKSREILGNREDRRYSLSLFDLFSLELLGRLFRIVPKELETAGMCFRGKMGRSRPTVGLSSVSTSPRHHEPCHTPLSTKLRTLAHHFTAN
jgi:hypothetical protein